MRNYVGNKGEVSMGGKENHDWRYKIAQKEAWVGICLVIIHFLWWYRGGLGCLCARSGDYPRLPLVLHPVLCSSVLHGTGI